MANYTQRPPEAQRKGKRKKLPVRALMATFPIRGDSVAEIIRKLVFIGALVAFVITGGTLLGDVTNELVQVYVKNPQIQANKNQGTINMSEEEIEEIKQQEPNIGNDYMALYAENNDLVGWINIGGENNIIDYPVTQTGDNDYYLTHNFYKENAATGTVFADYRNRIKGGDVQNFIVLYGHNTQYSTMFSKVTRYYYDKESGTNLGFYLANPTITFDTIYENATYKVFACALFNTEEQYGEIYNYLRRGAEFTDKDEFNQYILDIMDRSCIFTDVDITYGDDILVLSTCYFPFGMEYENVRCALFARKVREGESPEVDTSKATVNYNRLLFQQEIDRGMGTAWTTRTWDTSYLLSLD